MNTEILSVLDKHERLTVLEIADIIGAHPISVDRYCYQLYQRGYIRVYNAGIYSITEDGEHYLIQPPSERPPPGTESDT